MTQAYVVTEGKHDAQLLKKLLPVYLVKNIQFVEGGGRYGAESFASSIVSAKRLPVALVLDSDTTDERAIIERRELLRVLLRQAAPSIRSEVFLAVPEIEAIYFTDRRTTGAIAGIDLTDEMWEAALDRPKQILTKLVGSLNGDSIQQELITRIDHPEIIEQLRLHPLIQELSEFLSSRELKHATAKGPANFLDAIFEVIPNYRRQKKMYFAGIIDNVGKSSGLDGQADVVSLHLRDGIDLSDARDLLNLALDKVAEENGMTQERELTKLFYEDETGRDREL